MLCLTRFRLLIVPVFRKFRIVLFVLSILHVAVPNRQFPSLPLLIVVPSLIFSFFINVWIPRSIVILFPCFLFMLKLLDVVLVILNVIFSMFLIVVSMLPKMVLFPVLVVFLITVLKRIILLIFFFDNYKCFCKKICDIL